MSVCVREREGGRSDLFAKFCKFLMTGSPPSEGDTWPDGAQSTAVWTSAAQAAAPDRSTAAFQNLLLVSSTRSQSPAQTPLWLLTGSRSQRRGLRSDWPAMECSRFACRIVGGFSSVSWLPSGGCGSAGCVRCVDRHQRAGTLTDCGAGYGFNRQAAASGHLNF